jgi:undecaprenyl-diphosphatase
MGLADLVVALLAGVIQGVVEWLPVSSEAAVTLLLAGLGFTPAAAVRLALFLHVGTALAATVYYRAEIIGLFHRVPHWRPGHAFDADAADLSFLALATAVSAAVGFGAYRLLLDVATELSGGAFVGLIGALLIVTGLVQRAATESVLDDPRRPRPIDAGLVGIGQGLAVLPGVSRSGTTVSLLLLRGYDGETAFTLSFLLSIPAALGAGLLVVLDADGLPQIAPASAVVSLLASAVIGYATIGLLMRVVRRVAFWGLCVGFGALAVASGLLVISV